MYAVFEADYIIMHARSRSTSLVWPGILTKSLAAKGTLNLDREVDAEEKSIRK